MAKQYKIVINTPQGEQSFEVTQGTAANGQPLRLKVQGGTKYQFRELDATTGDKAPQYLRAKRVGKDLHVLFDDSQTADVILEDYYDQLPVGFNALIGQSEDGLMHEFVALDPANGVEVGALLDGGQSTLLALSSGEAVGSGAAVGLVAPAAAAGAGAATGGLGGVAAAAGGLAVAAGAGGGGGGGSSGPTPAAQALQLIQNAATVNNADGTISISTYSQAGVTGVSSDNLSAINNALDSAPVDGTAADTVVKVQAIVDAYNAILGEANGSAPDATPGANPTAQQYQTIGVALGTAATDAENLALLNDIVGASQTGDVDTIAELDNLARIANGIEAVAAGNTPSPQLSATDLATAGLSGVTADNLQAVLNAIAAKNDDGSETDSLAELQAIIDGLNNAAANIGANAEANTAATLTTGDYAAAGVTGVTSANLTAINDALNSGTPGAAASADGVAGSEADSPREIQAIVDAYNAILGEANDSNANAGDNVADATPASDPTVAQYQAIGVTLGTAATDAENLALLNDIVGASQTGDVDTIAELDNLARIANGIEAVAAGNTPSPQLTVADLTLIGLNTTGVTSDNLPTLLAAIAAKNNDGSETDSLSELQALVDALDKVAPSAATGITLTPSGGTVVANALNATNTAMDFAATITAGEATGGKAEFYVNGVLVGTDNSIAAGDTSVSYTTSDGTPTAAELQAAIAAGGQVSVKLYDAAGNNISANGPTLTRDVTAPTLHSSTAPATATTTVAGTAGDSTGETIALTITFDGNVNGLSSGSNSTVFTVGGTGVSATWSGVDGSNTRVLTYTIAAGQSGQAAIDEAALKAELVAGISDAAGNAFAYSGNIADIDSSALPVIDTTAPSAATGITLTPSGGTVVANALNGTNTAMDFAATITAGEATGGKAEFYVNGVLVGTDNSIAAGDTSVSYTTSDGTPTAAELQAAIAAGGQVSVKLYDAAGNNISANGPTLTRDVTAPVFSSGASASVAENTANTTVVYDGTADSDSGITYSLSGTDAASLNINASTGEVRLNSSADYETKSSYSFTVVATDAAGNVTNQAVTLGVTDVNDAPVNTVPAAQSSNEDTPLVVNGLSIADADAGSGTMTVTLSVAHGSLSVASGTGVTLSNNASASVQLSGTLTDINTLLASANAVTYTPTANYNGAETLTMLTSDGGNTGPGGTLTDSDTVSITVSAVNDAPVNTVPTAQTTSQDTAKVISGLSIADADAGSNSMTVTLSVAHGTITAAASSGVTIGTNGTASVTLTGTLTDINTLLGLASGITYTPASGYVGSDTLTMLTSDGGNTGTGGVLTDSDTVGLNTTLAAINLSAITAGNGGYAIKSASSGDVAGYSVSSAGDVNGDGIDDVIVGAYGSGANTGSSYVVFGQTGTPSAAIELSDLSGSTNGFVITGVASGDATGYSVSSLGDINGDGLADLLVSAHGANVGNGRAYVVYGKTNGADVNLATYTNGFKIDGSGTESAGFSLSNAGDVNGDGFADVLVGAYTYSSLEGRSYVVFGTSGAASTVTLSSLASSSRGFVISAESSAGRLGYSVSNAGDVNGDGLADLIVGAYSVSNGGKSYVVFGQTGSSQVEVSALASNSNGFVINAETTGDASGWAVSAAGDVNGDGLADLAILAPNADPTGSTDYGKAYVVYGKTSSAAVDLVDVKSGSGGFVINGFSVGASVEGGIQGISYAGDINGDGLADVIVSATPNSSGTVAGRSFVVFGQTGTAAIELTDVNRGLGGFVINGETSVNLNAGVSVSAAGDVNGDGFDDLLVGSNSLGISKSYVIFGGSQFMAASVAGTGTVTGTASGEAVVGSNAADTLSGGGGVDRFYGGDGKDTIVLTASDVSNLAATTGSVRALVDGGGDADTIRLSGGANLDLTAISNAGAMSPDGISRITGIERIDMGTDTAGNTLTLTGKDVNDMAGMNLIHTGSASADGNTWTNVSGTALSATTSYHQLVVDGNTADALNLKDSAANAWATVGTVSNGTDQYLVYQNNSTRSQVLVKSGVNVTGSVINVGATMANWAYSSGVGDVNGDGYEDFVITDWSAGQAAIDKIYVFFGNASGSLGTTAQVEAGVGGFLIQPDTAGDSGSGYALTKVGDINGDGLADILFGNLHNYDSTTNTSYGTPLYVVYGKTTTTTVNTSDLVNGIGGFRKSTGYGNGSLSPGGQIDYVSGLGDVNGDGFVDYSWQDGFYVTHVDYGGVNAASAGGWNITWENVGGGANSQDAGDFNGDGLSDIYVAAASGNQSFVVLGKTDSANLNLLNSGAVSGAVRITGGVTNARGHGVGDVNGDGLGDMVVVDTQGTKAYVVFGRTGTADINLSSLGAGGYLINYDNAWSFPSFLNGESPTVSAIGDVNGDGLADMAIGLSNGVNSDTTHRGSVYVVYGKTGTSAVNLSDITSAGLGGYLIKGSLNDQYLSNGGLSGLGDFNGDGLPDLGISGNKINAVLLGQASSSTGTVFVDQMGTPNDDTLTSTGAQVIAAGLGNDTLVASGADVLSGGAGNDTFVLGGTTTTALQSAMGAGGNIGQLAMVSGGTGFDTIRLTGGAALDLTLVANISGDSAALSSRVEGIERIDLATDTAANTLTLAGKDVNDMAGMNLIHSGSVSADGATWTNVSGTALSATTSYHQLVVDGTASDTVNLKGGSGSWVSVGTVNNGSSNYTVYQNDATHSQVLVKSGVTVNLNVAPVVIDLNGDGQIGYGQTLMDVNGDGLLDSSAWAGAQDGVLVRDANHDSRVSGSSEFAFARSDSETDLQGLAAQFDSNGDGMLNAQDAAFAEFGVWQDANGNGVSDAGELRSLSDLGIQSIRLTSDGVVSNPAAGVSESGRTTVQMQDGSTLLAADAAFAYQSGVVQDAQGSFSLQGAGLSLNLENLRAVAGMVNSVDLTGTGDNMLKLNLQDVLAQPLKVDGNAGDVVALFGAIEPLSATPTTLNGVAYQGYDVNHDGQLDLLVQQAIAVQMH